MDLDDGTVQRHRFNLDADDLSLLQMLEKTGQNPRLAPAIHARIDGVSVAEFQRQSAPFAALLSNMKHGVNDLKIADADITSLPWQTVFDLVILFLGDFHHPFCHLRDRMSISVNRP